MSLTCQRVLQSLEKVQEVVIDRISKDKYVPLATEAVNCYHIGTGLNFLGFALCRRVAAIWQHRNDTLEEEIQHHMIYFCNYLELDVSAKKILFGTKKLLPLGALIVSGYLVKNMI
jgi:hypothetical protein